MAKPEFSQPPTIEEKLREIASILPRGFAVDHYRSEGFIITKPTIIGGKTADVREYITKSYYEALAYARGCQAGYNSAVSRRS